MILPVLYELQPFPLIYCLSQQDLVVGEKLKRATHGWGCLFWAAEGIAPLLLPGCETNSKQMTVESFTSKFSASILSAFTTGRVYVALFVLLYIFIYVFQGHLEATVVETQKIELYQPICPSKVGTVTSVRHLTFLRFKNVRWWGSHSSLRQYMLVLHHPYCQKVFPNA